jgi:hypothetical protein
MMKVQARISTGLSHSPWPPLPRSVKPHKKWGRGFLCKKPLVSADELRRME